MGNLFIGRAGRRGVVAAAKTLRSPGYSECGGTHFGPEGVPAGDKSTATLLRRLNHLVCLAS